MLRIRLIILPLHQEGLNIICLQACRMCASIALVIPDNVIPPNYDSMIVKLIVKGKDREEAISPGAKRALKEFHIGGVHSTIPFHRYMLEDEDFLNSNYDLTYIDKLIAEGCQFKRDQ